ncbi:MAG: methyltransferase domain-containing protein [Thermoplasmatales archaeon]|nr:MAG: methyltransferase domain-containing protein [Thermoplasmatales archaeon]
MIEEDEEWEDIYRKYPLEEIPWHSDEPDKNLIEVLRKKNIKIGYALDVCSGAGTNSVFLAEKGFDVTGIDISETAMIIGRQRAEKAGISEKCKFFSGDIFKRNYQKTNSISSLTEDVIIIYQKKISQNS